MTWKTVKLGEITVGGKGSYGIGAPAVDFNPLKYTYLRITDINDDGTINYAGLKSVDDPEAYKYILKPNDIVFARTGATTGRTYFYLPQDGTFVYAGFLIKFSIDPKKANPRLLKYITHSQEYYDWVRSFDTGGTRGNINAKTFADMPLCLPDRASQDKIVSILSSLDDKIENNNRINRNLEAQAQALFKSWFVDFEPWGGKMPEDWKEGSFGDIAKVTSGKRPPMKEVLMSPKVSIPLIGAADTMGYTNTALFVTPILVTGRVGTHGVVQRFNEPCWPSDNTLVVESDRYEFTYQTMIRIDYHNMNRGSTQPLITQTDLKNQKVIIPIDSVILDFERRAALLYRQISGNKAENQRLATLRDTLLPKLMKGEIAL